MQYTRTFERSFMLRQNDVKKRLGLASQRLLLPDLQEVFTLCIALRALRLQEDNRLSMTGFERSRIHFVTFIREELIGVLIPIYMQWIRTIFVSALKGRIGEGDKRNTKGV